MSDDQVSTRTVGKTLAEAKRELGLNRYPEHIMEGGNVVDNTYRYDLGKRWMFLTIYNESDRVKRAFFADKR